MPFGGKIDPRKVVPIRARNLNSTATKDKKGVDDDDFAHDDFERQINLDMEAFQEDMHFSEPVIASSGSNSRAAGGGGANIVPALSLDGDTSRESKKAGEEEAEEEVLLLHEMPGAAAKSAEALRKAFKALQVVVEEFRKRAETAEEERKAQVKRVFELEDKIDFQEDEINSLQQQLSMAGPGGMKIVGAGGGGGGGGGMGAKKNNANDKLRQELNRSGGDEGFGDLGLTDNDGAQTYRAQFTAWVNKNKPFQRDVRMIQAKFGSAVASYFVFYRFIFLQICLIAGVAVIFATIHITLLSETATFAQMWTAPGQLPGFMLFSSYREIEAFQYGLFVIFGILVFCVSIAEHLIAEDQTMKRIDASEEGNEAPYSKAIFCCWDISGAGYNPTKRQVDDQTGALANAYMQMIEETHNAGLMKTRSRYEIFALFLRRSFAFFLYLIVQLGSFGAIIFLTVNTAEVTELLSKTPLRSFASVLAPLVLNVVNALAPPLLKKITHFERWDSGQMQLNILLFRMFFSNILNTLILSLSYLMLADPFLFADWPIMRNALQLVESFKVTEGVRDTVFTCRVDQAADAMFTLILSNFFIGLISMLAWGYIPMWIYECFPSYLGQHEPFPFEVEPAMINLFNNMSLVMIVLPFAPLSMIFLPITVCVTLKMEVFVMMRFFGKPERTWKSHQSGVIFTSFYIVTSVIILLPAGIYFLSSTSFPKDCDIQDKGTDLCLSNTLVSNNDVYTCDLDSTNTYYYFWTTRFKTSRTNNIEEFVYTDQFTYPSEFCDNKCGPFVSYEYNLLPVREVVYQSSALQTIWKILFDGSYLAWLVVIIMVIQGYTRKNTQEVTKETDQAKEKVLTVQVEALEAERRRQEKIIVRLKAQQAAAEEAANMITAR
jgi:hypothetical protein